MAKSGSSIKIKMIVIPPRVANRNRDLCSRLPFCYHIGMISKVKIGISSCLLGENVRYDGGNRLDNIIIAAFDQLAEWAPVCPEVECGLPVPREAMRLTGDPDKPRLVTKVSGIDHTERMTAWAMKKVEHLKKEGLCGFIFKSRSPSSGLRDIEICTSSGEPSGKGTGIFAGIFIKSMPLMPVEDDIGIHDPVIWQNFIKKVIEFKRMHRYDTETGKYDDNIICFNGHCKRSEAI